MLTFYNTTDVTSQLEGLKARLEQHLLQRQHNHLGGHNQLGRLAEGKTKQPHDQRENNGKQGYMLGSSQVLQKGILVMVDYFYRGTAA